MPEPPKESKIVCAECGKEVTLKDGEGDCPGCGLDMGSVVRYRRVRKAAKKMDEAEAAEKDPPKRRRTIF